MIENNATWSRVYACWSGCSFFVQVPVVYIFQGRKNQMENAIIVKNLVKKYDGFTAVDGISFEGKEGELFAFLGENGAGKSTTINILCTITFDIFNFIVFVRSSISYYSGNIRIDV